MAHSGLSCGRQMIITPATNKPYLTKLLFYCMRYKLRDNQLNGHLKLFSEFHTGSEPFTIDYHTFIWNRVNVKHWELDLVPVQVPPQCIFSLSPGQTLYVSRQTNDYVVIQFYREFYYRVMAYCLTEH